MDVRTWISDRAEATAASCCGDEGEGTNSAYSNSTGKTEESEKTFAECPSTRGTPLLDTVGKLGCDPGSSCGYESGTNGSGESKETGVYSHCKLILLLSYLRIMRRNSQICYIYIIYLEPLTLIDACDRLFHSYQNDISDLVCYTVVQSLFHHKLLSTSSKLM